MHTVTFVLGDDPEARLDAHAEKVGADWWAIGGRYQGSLTLWPGATGKRWGDCLTPFETWIAANMPEVAIYGRPGTDPTPLGVDQARLKDIVAGPEAGFVLDVSNQWHEIPDEVRFWVLRHSMERATGKPITKSPAEVDRLYREWCDRVADLLDEAGGDCLLTIVDVHH